MKPANKKRKGKLFEEYIAEILHNVFLENNKEYKDLYLSLDNENLKPKRDASSGTFLFSSGDIELNLLRKFFPFSIECKHWKTLDLSLNSLSALDKTKLYKIWIDQVLPVSRRSNLFPLLVFKANYTKVFALLEKDKIDLQFFKFYLVFKDLVIVLFDDLVKYYSKKGEYDEDSKRR